MSKNNNSNSDSKGSHGSISHGSIGVARSVAIVRVSHAMEENARERVRQSQGSLIRPAGQGKYCYLKVR